MKPKNLLHQTFNRLTAIGIAGFTAANQAKWLWRCSCGVLVVIRANDVRSGKSQSCGCLGRAVRSARSTTHGATTNGGVPEYYIRATIIQRCTNPNNKDFKYYGGRGITICERWRESFEDFYADMGPRPSPELTIERINNNKGYSPSNCKWATRTEQMSNRQCTRKEKAA